MATPLDPLDTDEALFERLLAHYPQLTPAELVEYLIEAGGPDMREMLSRGFGVD